MILSKYQEVMERIDLTADMRDRILRNIAARLGGALEPGRSFRKWLPLLGSLAAAAVLLVVLLPQLTDIVPPQPGGSDTPSATAYGPTEYDSLEQLSTAIDFSISDLENLPLTPTQTDYVAWGTEYAQIIYSDGVKRLVYIKSLGDEDNSGDYTVYDTEKETSVNGNRATTKLSGDGAHLILWQDETYSYSIYSSLGMAEEDLIALAETAQ